MKLTENYTCKKQFLDAQRFKTNSHMIVRLRRFFVIVLLGTSINTFGQLGGEQTFQFLNFSSSARVEALGGYQLSVFDKDANLGIENPALINTAHHGYLNLNYVNYFADTEYGYASYSRSFRGIGTFTGSFLYANYGKFKQADIDGNFTGVQFSANDLALNIGYGIEIDSNLSVGGALVGSASYLESYSAYGLSIDLGAVYHKEANGLGIAAVVKNFGTQLKSYTPDGREPMPLNILFAFSKKMAHAPFRFSATYHNAQKWDIIYFDPSTLPTIDPLTGETIEIKYPGFKQKFMRHMTFGGEMILTENFNIRVGYNHKVRKENQVGIKPGLTGFSWGLGFKVKRFNIAYALSKKHVAGTANHITISTKIGKDLPIDPMYIQHGF